MANSEHAGGHQLTFDRKRKQYITENKKYIIRPPLDEAIKKEVLCNTELATTRFVLWTNNATMYVPPLILCTHSMCTVKECLLSEGEL